MFEALAPGRFPALSRHLPSMKHGDENSTLRCFEGILFQLGVITPNPNGDLVTGETYGLPHSLGLQQMAALVLRDYFQASANRKAQHRDERILKADTVHVIFACSPD